MAKSDKNVSYTWQNEHISDKNVKYTWQNVIHIIMTVTCKMLNTMLHTDKMLDTHCKM